MDAEIERILAEADKDGDGHIDYNEFVELMSEWDEWTARLRWAGLGPGPGRGRRWAAGLRDGGAAARPR